jgi:hypothetical protein
MKDHLEDWEHLRLVIFNNVAIGKKIGKQVIKVFMLLMIFKGTAIQFNKYFREVNFYD